MEKKQVMYAPNGYFPNGKNRPMRKVVIIKEIGPTDLIYIRYCDNGEKSYAYKRHLRDKEE